MTIGPLAIVGDAAPADPPAARIRLPNRRECYTETIKINGRGYSASVGFDPGSGEPKEIFLAGAKSGSDMDGALADAAILVSITLQSGIPAELLAPSMSRIPAGFDDQAPARASVLGAALDLVARYEAEVWR